MPSVAFTEPSVPLVAALASGRAVMDPPSEQPTARAMSTIIIIIIERFISSSLYKTVEKIRPRRGIKSGKILHGRPSFRNFKVPYNYLALLR
jgi:hypothetical protein